MTQALPISGLSAGIPGEELAAWEEAALENSLGTVLNLPPLGSDWVGDDDLWLDPGCVPSLALRYHCLHGFATSGSGLPTYLAEHKPLVLAYP